jgi:cytidylate kinase
VVIAIDGPAGAGKSTVAKKVANKLGIFYLDTGAMYRAFTLYVMKKNVNFNNNLKIERLLQSFALTISEDCVCIQGLDVTKEIRREDVTAAVSYISSLDFVRKKMVELQREIGKNRDIIVEGRDIGTVVFPDTPYKFYLDAAIDKRAVRRLKDEKNQEIAGTIQTIKEKINKRDEFDSSRKVSPLKQARDAVYIDSTHLRIDEVCNTIIQKVKYTR